MAISASRQRNAVSVGIALGLAELDRPTLMGSNLDFSFAFEAAWGSWDAKYRSLFSQVQTDLNNGSDAYGVMTHADEKKQVPKIFWRRVQGGYEVMARANVSVEDWDAEALARRIDGGVPVAGWVSLAVAFLKSFDG